MRPLSSSRSHKSGAGANDSSYIYPTISQIREVHDIVLREYPGAERLEELGNIVTLPKKAALHQGCDVFDKASAYARSIAQKMLFKNRNKRTALAASLAFLEINGVIDHDYYEPILHEAILYLSQGDISEEHFAQFLRDAFSETNRFRSRGALRAKTPRRAANRVR
jgi:prophage maintenance system killer protein